MLTLVPEEGHPGAEALRAALLAAWDSHPNNNGFGDAQEQKEEKMFELAAKLFAAAPASNGRDDTYERVKKELRAAFGHKCVHANTKERLKALAVNRRRVVDRVVDTTAECSTPQAGDRVHHAAKGAGVVVVAPDGVGGDSLALRVEFESGEIARFETAAALETVEKACDEQAVFEHAAKRFCEPPYSNGRDQKYERVKEELRRMFGPKCIHAGNKRKLKKIAMNGPVRSFKLHNRVLHEERGEGVVIASPDF